MKKRKILIIGPIENHGGRELEAGFIASSLYGKYEISVCSTGNIDKTSQLFFHSFQGKVTSLKKLLYLNNFSLKPATLFSYFKNGKKHPVYFYVNNRFNVNLNLKKKEVEQLTKLIGEQDLVFIIAHLFTLRTREIIEIAKESGIELIFRTTGEIGDHGHFPTYLRQVDHFIHHTIDNAKKINDLSTGSIIDQTSYIEESLLELPLGDNRVQRFGVIARLSPEKNILNLIRYFKNCASQADELFIIGEGELKSEILAEIGEDKRIALLGSKSLLEMAKHYAEIDCLIIPSYSEAGPLVGVEAMAAARLILSTRVGAMPERLSNTGNDFWFDAEDEMSFQNEFRRIKMLRAEEIRKISIANRKKYLANYSSKEIAGQYHNVIEQVLDS